ncbi:hypothetical protein Efla_004924 [Eimeria flavescens]
MLGREDDSSLEEPPLSVASTRSRQTAPPALTLAEIDRLMEPLSLQLPPGPPGDGESAESMASVSSPTFVSRLREQVFALSQLLRRTAGPVGPRTEEEDTQGASVQQLQQKKKQLLQYFPFLAVALTGVWGFRASRSVERVIARRYSDIAYQIRRPDALSARISAFKFLVLGGLVLPGSAVAVAGWQSASQSARRLRMAHADHSTEETCVCEDHHSPHAGQTTLPAMLPLPLQAEMRRMVASFHGGLSTFIEAVTPSKQNWQHWALGEVTVLDH